MSTEKLRSDFDELDVNKNGYVTVEELRTSLGPDPKISDGNIATIVKLADEDGDHQISFAEYMDLMR